MNFADTNWLASAYLEPRPDDAGTFDTAIVASVKLAGGTRFLSFDTTARAMAAAEGIDVFPVLATAERQLLYRLKHGT